MFFCYIPFNKMYSLHETVLYLGNRKCLLRVTVYTSLTWLFSINWWWYRTYMFEHYVERNLFHFKHFEHYETWHLLNIFTVSVHLVCYTRWKITHHSIGVKWIFKHVKLRWTESVYGTFLCIIMTSFETVHKIYVSCADHITQIVIME